MSQRKDKADNPPKRALVQLSPDVGDLLEEISSLTGVSVARLVVNCVVRNHPRLLKKLDAAHEFHQLATGENDSTRKNEIKNGAKRKED